MKPFDWGLPTLVVRCSMSSSCRKKLVGVLVRPSEVESFSVTPILYKCVKETVT